MEGLQNLRYFLQEGDGLCKLNLKDTYYCVPLQKKLMRNPVPMFWLRSCHTNFHKTIENSNCNFVSHKYKNDYLIGRHASNGSLHK